MSADQGSFIQDQKARADSAARRERYGRLVQSRLDEQDFAASTYQKVFNEISRDGEVDLTAVKEDINNSSVSKEKKRFLKQFVYDLEITQGKVVFTEGLIKHNLDRNSIEPTEENIGIILFRSSVEADPVGEVKTSAGIASLKMYVENRTDYIRLYGRFSDGTGFFRPYQKMVLPLEGTYFTTHTPLAVIFTGERRSEDQIRQTEMHEEAHAINQRLIVTRATFYSKENSLWRLYNRNKVKDLIELTEGALEIEETGIPIVSGLVGKLAQRLSTEVERSSFEFATLQAWNEIVAMQVLDKSKWRFIFSDESYDYYKMMGLRPSQLEYSRLGKNLDRSRDRYIKFMRGVFEYVGSVRQQIPNDEHEKLILLLRDIPISRWQRELRRRYGVSVADKDT